jgi:homoserine acetyltransferase
MEPVTVKLQEVVNVPIMLSDEMIDAIVKRVTERMDLNQIIDDQIEYYMSSTFDINDYTRNLDTHDITRGIVDDVIETIKDRL